MQMCPCEAKWTVARCFVFLQSEWNKKRKRLIMLWIVDTLPLRYLCHWRHFKMPWILKINTLWIRLEFEMFTEMIHDSHNPPLPGKSTIKQYFVATSKSVVYHRNKCFLSLLEENGQILTHILCAGKLFGRRVPWGAAGRDGMLERTRERRCFPNGLRAASLV